ncbi:SSI family serine proteinase inhibitor [Streptomyces sp. 6N223]|uniref:SSI family serine proteinase inhibitor n=1 Tax=Streptomyces sp. 6N223 TaxID=3457412 RepID=UPI003FCF77EB
MLHRSLALALATAAASVSGPAAAAVALTPAGWPAHGAAANHLVITITESGETDGTYELYCDPARGFPHPEPLEACDALHRAEEEAPGGDPFAPVPDDALCTYMYGGPAVAQVEGTWQGEPVNARFERSDGCEIARWDRLVPALPRIAGDRA